MMRRIATLLLPLALAFPISAEPTPPLDSLIFGDPASEAAHNLRATHSRSLVAALDQPARQLLPRDELAGANWLGGEMSFTMKVDPERPNYVTVKFWGGDADAEAGRLMLFIDGKQIGQRHLGEVDMLDIMAQTPRFPGRFVYKTLPLPQNMTRGKSSVQLTIQGQGKIWGYGNTIEKFQKPMIVPSRGIYRAYTHVDPFLSPANDEVQGQPMTDAPVRSEPGDAALQEVKDRVNKEIVKQLGYGDELRQVFIQFMAKAYHTPWTVAYQDPQVIEKIVRGIDYRYRVFQQNPDIIKDDPQTWNHDWFGYGPTADAVRLLAAELKPYLDETIEGTDVPRRQGWADMFIASRDWHVTRRRQYTNQSMIKDTYGIYLCNRGVAVVDPSRAWPEEKALGLLYESAGLEPWRGSWDAAGNPTLPLGDDYFQLTDAGLTKELGFVGNYGEVIDWAVAMYDATRPPGSSADAKGDPRLHDQLIKIARARAVFRYPLPDEQGHRAMQLETVIGWRDSHYPGGVVYDQRTSWDGGPLEAAAATLDPVLVGYAQQMLADNQFFAAVQQRMKERGFRTTAGLLAVPGAYEAIVSQPDQPTRLPMAPGQPDFVFADPQIGTVAIKHGDEILYASLYWRARYAINNLARIHYLTPTIECDATIRQETRFEDSGLKYTLPDITNEAQSTRHEKFYKAAGMYSARAGQEQPIARIPESVKSFKPGKENVYAGKGDFYHCRYGDYVIAMNCTDDKSFAFDGPEGYDHAKDLVTGQVVDLAHPVQVGPRKTIVLYLGSR